MAEVRSILWWLCGIAAVFCLAPKAVSDLSGFYAGPGALQARRRSRSGLQLRHPGCHRALGMLRRWGGGHDVLREAAFRSVRMAHGVLPAPASASSRSPGSRKMAASNTNGLAWRKTGILKSELQGNAQSGILSGYFVDHDASTCAPGAPCSPYFRDSWANPGESRDGFHFGGSSAPSSLVDYPFGWDVMQRITCICKSCARLRRDR